jgi:hypothetical protein
MQKKFKPKEMIAAFSDLGASANNLAYRRALGFVVPTAKTARATLPNLYAPYHALVYGVGLAFEKLGIDTQKAFHLASELIEYNFLCAYQTEEFWAVEFGNETNSLISLSELPSTSAITDGIIVLEPILNVSIWINKDDYLYILYHLEKIKRVAYYNLTGILFSCVCKLCIPFEDIQEMLTSSEMRKKKRDKKPELYASIRRVNAKINRELALELETGIQEGHDPALDNQEDE